MYQVEWARSATSALTNFWLTALSAERRRINDAVVQIDSLLSANPQEQGESRTADQRILLVPPLAAIFKVLEQERRVKVLRVLRFRPHAH
jgi:hypothetical protein